MRKIYLCFAAIGSMAIMGGIAACSSDDSTGGGPTTDSGTADTYVPPTDSGGPKDSGGGTDAGPCVHCAELITGEGALTNACADSLNLALTAIACTCANPPSGTGEGLCDVDSGTLSADGGPGACAAFCASPTTTLPDNTCIGCGATNCTAAFTACEEDTSHPADAGTGDAGDAGDGG